MNEQIAPEVVRERAEAALVHAVGRARMHLAEALKQAIIAAGAEYVGQEDPAAFITTSEYLERGALLETLVALDLPSLRVLSEVADLLNVIQPGDHVAVDVND